MRGAHQIGLRAGRARPLYRLTLARPPFPLPFPCPLSLSLSCPSLSLSLPHGLTSPASLSPTSSTSPRPPQRAPGAPPTTLGAGADQRAPCPAHPASATSDPWSACPHRRGASHRLFSFCSAASSPTGGWRPAAAPPTPRLRVLRGWAPLPCQTRCRLRLETVSPELLNPSRRRRRRSQAGLA